MNEMVSEENKIDSETAELEAKQFKKEMTKKAVRFGQLFIVRDFKLLFCLQWLSEELYCQRIPKFRRRAVRTQGALL